MIIQEDMLLREEQFRVGEGVFSVKRTCIITKDEFIACYNKWVKEEEYRLNQLKLITELVQEYADKETPEKICDESDTCWGREATTLLGKIADILKIDRCEEGEDNETN